MSEWSRIEEDGKGDSSILNCELPLLSYWVKTIFIAKNLTIVQISKAGRLLFFAHLCFGASS